MVMSIDSNELKIMHGMQSCLPVSNQTGVFRKSCKVMNPSVGSPTSFVATTKKKSEMLQQFTTRFLSLASKQT
jgi:hypothetical protein